MKILLLTIIVFVMCSFKFVENKTTIVKKIDFLSENKTEDLYIPLEIGITKELLKRQSFKESTFNQFAVSPKGCKGLTQIGSKMLEDYFKKVGYTKIDLFNPSDAIKIQKFAMEELYNSSFINKPNQLEGVRIAKTLAAYNWGRGNLSKYLVKQKNIGVDIYNSYEWINNLPKETRDYIDKILFKKSESFNKEYQIAVNDSKYKEVINIYDNTNPLIRSKVEIQEFSIAKYDLETIRIPDIVYHTSQLNFENKILIVSDQSDVFVPKIENKITNKQVYHESNATHNLAGRYD